MIRPPINQRGISLSVNMLIIVAIGLVVLVISVMMYLKSSRTADTTINSCGLAGKCVDVPEIDGQQLCSSVGRGTAIGKCEKPKICCQLNQDEIEAALKTQTPTTTTN